MANSILHYTPNDPNASNAPNLLCEHFAIRRLVQKERISPP